MDTARPEGIGDSADAAALLVEVSHALATEPEPDRALTLVLRRLVPAMADWGTIRLSEPDGRVRRVAALAGDPAKAPLIEELLSIRPFDTPAEDEVQAMFGEARVQVYENLGDLMVEAFAPEPEARRIWMGLGLRSVAVAPFMSEGRTFGAIVLANADPDRRFDPAHVEVLESLAAQCALLVANTRLVREVESAGRERVNVRSVLDTLLGHAPVATAILDDELVVLHANEAFVAVATGGPGTSLADALPDLEDALVPMVASALSEGCASDRVVLRSTSMGAKDDGRGYWQVTAFPIDAGDGSRFGVGLFLSDISEDRRVARRLTDSLARLDLSLTAGGLGAWDWDLIRNEIVWSDRAHEVLRLPAAAFDRDPMAFLAFIVPEDRERHAHDILQAAELGQEYRANVRVQGQDIGIRWIEVHGRVVTTAAGTPRRMIGVAADVTDRQLSEEIKARLLEREHVSRVQAEAARERLALLAEASAALIDTLEPQAGLELLPELLVPRLCDWCIVDAIDDGGELVEIAKHHREAGLLGAVGELRNRRRAAGGDGLWSVRRAIRSGRSELVVDIGDADLMRVAEDDEHLALLRRLAPTSAIVAPLVARGRVLGGLTLVTSGDRHFESDDLTLAESLAARAAMVFDNARLYESRSQVARALQQTLLPPALPPIPHIDMVARYRVAAGGIDIGGDFYDVFDLHRDAWAVIVGDVCGKGPGAAAVTGLFRHTIRAVAISESSPAAILRATNDAILGQIDDTRFCTAALVRIEPGPDGTRAMVACGGHPRPVLVRTDGTVERVDVRGTLLGVLPEPNLPEVAVDLAPGDAMVLYTDGVTEARRGAELFGEARLIEALAGAHPADGCDAAQIADRLEAALDAFSDGTSNDDIAIVVIQACPSPDGLTGGPASGVSTGQS